MDPSNTRLGQLKGARAPCSCNTLSSLERAPQTGTQLPPPITGRDSFPEANRDSRPSLIRRKSRSAPGCRCGQVMSIFPAQADESTAAPGHVPVDGPGPVPVDAPPRAARRPHAGRRPCAGRRPRLPPRPDPAQQAGPLPEPDRRHRRRPRVRSPRRRRDRGHRLPRAGAHDRPAAARAGTHPPGPACPRARRALRPGLRRPVRVRRRHGRRQPRDARGRQALRGGAGRLPRGRHRDPRDGRPNQRPDRRRDLDDHRHEGQAGGGGRPGRFGADQPTESLRRRGRGDRGRVRARDRAQAVRRARLGRADRQARAFDHRARRSSRARPTSTSTPRPGT